MTISDKVQYGNFLNTHYGVDEDNLNPLDNKSDTKLSRKFDASRRLVLISDRLTDGVSLMTDAANTLSNDKATKTSKKEALRVITTSIVGLMKTTSTACRDAALILAPVASVTYAQKREDVRKKKEMIASNSKNKPISLLLVDDLIAGGRVKSKTKGKVVVERRQSTRKRKADDVIDAEDKLALSEPMNLSPPVPANGEVYGVGEFLHIISQLPKRRRKCSRAGMIKTMMSDEFQYVRQKRSAVYNVIADAEAGHIFEFDEEWRSSGRPPLISDDGITELSIELKRNIGEKTLRTAVNDMLVKACHKNGLMCDTNKRFNRTTLNNYISLLASKEGISLVHSSIAKTNNRWTAEHSFIGTMALIILIAMTHFYVDDKEDPEWNQILEELPDEKRLFINLVSEFHGGKSIRVRKPHLITNQDDCTFFICEGVQPDNSSEIGLVATSALADKSTSSIHHSEDSNKMNGLRTKLHLLMNAAGDSAPPCFCFAGLSDTEMPDDKFIVWEVEGMCVGGYGVGKSVGVGYVLFMRGTKGAEKARFKWIRENLLFPFVNWARKEYDGFDVDTGAPISDDLTAVSWCDGDNSQIDSIVCDEGVQRYADNKVIANKHNASGTGKEQANDLGKVFIVSKNLNKTTTLEHIPRSQHRLKASISQKFDDFSKKLRIKKQDAIIDFLAKIPTILSRACVRENVIAGYVANGFIDEKYARFPLFEKVVATCKKMPKLHEFNMFKSTFNPLMHYSYDNGNQYIGDRVFMEYGFPADIDANGEEKIRDATISQENQQRAKCLTAVAEIASRARRNHEIELETQRKENQEQAKIDQKCSEDQMIVDTVCSLAKLDSSEDNLVHCTLEHFDHLKAPELRAFIITRHPSYTKVSQIGHLKHPRAKKQALHDAQNGVENCLSVAYAVRTLKSRAVHVPEVNTVDEDGTAAWSHPPLISRVALRPCQNNAFLPSQILGDQATVRWLLNIFDPEQKMHTTDFISRPMDERTVEQLAKSDLLLSKLQFRLKSHIKRKVKITQQNNKCLGWASRNMAAVAAYMIVACHVKEDISCLDDSKCLLSKPDGDHFLLCHNDELNLQGCYLHFDTNNDSWIRSGSAAGKGGFGKRLDTHRSKAESNRNDDNSRFYHCYPSRKSSRSKNKSKDGVFEQLTPYVGAGFSDSLQPGTLSQKENGIFSYTNEEIEWISALNFRGKSGEQKYMQMVAYLFELGYDLALAPRDNVSDSPGFEGCGLIFNKAGRNSKA